MASYRDARNPEAFHFPGRLSSRIFLASVVAVCMLLAAGEFVAGTWMSNPVGLSLVTLLIAVCGAAWPREILLDQFGISQGSLTGRRRVNWEDVRAVEIGRDWGLPPGGRRLATTTIRVSSLRRAAAIVHSPRHSDPKRFAFELHRHNAKLPEALCGAIPRLGQPPPSP